MKKTFEQFTIDRYHNTITLTVSDPELKEIGQFGNPRKYKNYNWWVAVMNYLRSRGFSVTSNPYFTQQYEALSTQNKLCKKRDVVCLLTNNVNTITLEFGHLKNLWLPQSQSFWDNPTDNRYTHLSYLEGLAVELEIVKLIQRMKNLNIQGSGIDRKKPLPHAEDIIQKLQLNKHIHGDIKSLEQLANVVNERIKSDDYFGKYNSVDKNKKTLVCGEIKYFYDYQRRLRCGTVYHNINNMWWVLSGGSRYNVACFDLFDYDPELPKKEPIRRGQFENIITKFLNEKNYLKCHILEQRKKVLFPESINEK